jgi:UDP-glucose 4-epimerase
MRFAVTGGAGYIGSITTRLLLDSGHECVVLDTLERGWQAAVDSRAKLVVGSVGDRQALDEVLPGCDAVMHLAGYIEVAESVSDPHKYHRNNAEEPLVMLDAMLEHGVGGIVFSSTAAVYGEPEMVPVTEDAPTRPVNPYGESKLRFERSLDEYAARGLRSIRFRYFNVAGAWPDGSLGESHEPETHIIPRILGSMRDGRTTFEVFGGDYETPDGTCVRDYIHVLDLADAHRIGLERLAEGEAGGVYNLGTGRGFSNLEVVRACAAVTGRDVSIEVGPRRPGDPAVLVASAQKARSELGWVPVHGELERMIADAWSWHEQRPDGFR